MLMAGIFLDRLKALDASCETADGLTAADASAFQWASGIMVDQA
jgi:hypothetical protein